MESLHFCMTAKMSMEDIRTIGGLTYQGLEEKFGIVIERIKRIPEGEGSDEKGRYLWRGTVV